MLFNPDTFALVGTIVVGLLTIIKQLFDVYIKRISNKKEIEKLSDEIEELKNKITFLEMREKTIIMRSKTVFEKYKFWKSRALECEQRCGPS